MVSIKDTTTQAFVKDVIEESKRQPVLIDFWAPWCGPCKQLTPVLEKVVKAAKGKVKLVKMNIDEHPAIPGQMGIQSIPAVIAFVNGQPADGFMGALPESQVTAFIERLTKDKIGGEDQVCSKSRTRPSRKAITPARFTLALVWLSVALGLAAKTVETASNTPMFLTLLPFLGSGFVPTESMPTGLRWFAEYQPFTAVNETLRGLLMGTPIGNHALIAIIWCIAITATGYLWPRTSTTATLPASSLSQPKRGLLRRPGACIARRRSDALLARPASDGNAARCVPGRRQGP